MSSDRPLLSRAELETFDSAPQGAGVEKRFRCPFCQNPERAFHVNLETGVFNCKRASCRATGQLSDFWRHPPDRMISGNAVPGKAHPSPRERARASLAAAFGIGASPSSPQDLLPSALNNTPPIVHASQEPQQSPTSKGGNWRELWEIALPIESPGAESGAKYLHGRGLSVEVASAAGVRFSAQWAPSAEGKSYRAGSAVLYPSTGEGGEVVAVSGRYLSPLMGSDGKPIKARTGGQAKQGVFQAPAHIGSEWVSPFDRRLDAVILVEGQADALSLAEAGFPAIAAGGVNLSPWLHRRAGLRRVFIGIDADAGGDTAAPQWEAYLKSYGAKCARLTPENAKDWNEMLAGDPSKGTTGIGREALADWLMWQHSNFQEIV